MGKSKKQSIRATPNVQTHSGQNQTERLLQQNDDTRHGPLTPPVITSGTKVSKQTLKPQLTSINKNLNSPKDVDKNIVNNTKETQGESIIPEKLLPSNQKSNPQHEETISNQHADQRLHNDETNNDDEGTNQMDEDPPAVTILEIPMQYKAYIPSSDVPGNSPAQIAKVSRTLFKYKGFRLAKLLQKGKRGNKEKIIQVIFSDKTDFESLLNEEFRWSDDESAPPSKFLSHDDLRPKPSDEEIRDEKSRTIQVVDIPLYIKRNVLTTKFSKYGNIIKINTKAKGLYQQAYITYENKDDIAPFYQEWSTDLGAEMVRVIPIDLSEEKREERAANYLKLAGIPYRFSSSTLYQMLQNQISIQACFIPKDNRNYKNRNYAFIYFRNEENKEIAKNEQIHINLRNNYKKPLFWMEASQKSCHRCGSPFHEAINCDAPDRPQKKMLSPTQAWKQAPFNKKSYAQAVAAKKNKKKPTKPNGPKLQPDLSKTNEDTGHKVFQQQLEKISQRITLMSKTLSEIVEEQKQTATQLTSMAKRRINKDKEANNNNKSIPIQADINPHKRTREDDTSSTISEDEINELYNRKAQTDEKIQKMELSLAEITKFIANISNPNPSILDEPIVGGDDEVEEEDEEDLMDQ